MECDKGDPNPDAPPEGNAADLGMAVMRDWIAHVANGTQMQATNYNVQVGRMRVCCVDRARPVSASPALFRSARCVNSDAPPPPLRRLITTLDPPYPLRLPVARPRRSSLQTAAALRRTRSWRP